VPLDPDVDVLMKMLGEQGFRSFEELGIEGTRSAVTSFTNLQKPPQDVAYVSEEAYGPAGENRARIYVPPGDGPLPVVLYVHGGGFVAGGLDVVDEPVRALALDVGAIVVSTTYRLAPEARFPAAHDDVFAALRWTAGAISAYGGDAERLAVVGDSAGANLAAAAVIRARDAGAPTVRAQALLYPLVDPVADTPSRHEFAEGYLIHRAALEWFNKQYLTKPSDTDDPRLALHRNNLTNLPATLILTTEFDPLRDEGEAFAAALQDAGVAVTARRIDGLVHALFWASAAVPRSAEIHAALVRHLRDTI
jgi:acetyl esterase